MSENPSNPLSTMITPGRPSRASLPTPNQPTTKVRFTWVAATTGIGGDSKGITPAKPSQGGELMGFMNMSTGDAPLFHALARPIYASAHAAQD